MMERAELIDADLSIESAANEGTKVTLSLKVNPKILKKPF
jgi:signal transduction histidine kinase